MGLGAWPAQAQASLAGQVCDQESHRPLGFVSIGVMHQPYGTVADAQGRFALSLPASYDADSVRFSLVGYASATWQVASLRQHLRTGTLLLRPQPVPLAEAQVRSAGLRRRVLGHSTLHSTIRFEDFAANMAGNQLGQLMPIKRPAFLEEVSLGITDCSYDTVWFRLNIYKLQRGFPVENILPTAIYFRVSQRQTAGRVYLNLRRYRLYLTEDVVVAVELIRSLGRGTLAFGCQLTGGGPFFKLEQTPGPNTPRNVQPKNSVSTVDLKRQQPDGPWVKYPHIGLGIDATILEVPN